MKAIKYLSVISLFLLIISCSTDDKETITLPTEDTISPNVTISFNGLSSSSANEPIVLSDELRFTVSTEDASGVAKVEVFISEEKVAEDTRVPFEFVIDLSSYASKKLQLKKDYTLKVVATDTAGNETTKEFVINIPQKLITLNFPMDEMNAERNKLFVFASQMDGTLLAIAEVPANENSITLYSEIEVADDLEYMLTIAEKNNAIFGETNELTTIQNINRATLKEINLKSRPRFSSDFFARNIPNEIDIEGFWDENTTELSFITGSGQDFVANAICNCPFNFGNPPPETELKINLYLNTGNAQQTDKLYLQFGNAGQNISESLLLDRDALQNNFVLTRDMFSSEAMTLEEFLFTNLNTEESQNPGLTIYAYDSEEDFSNNNYYTLDPFNVPNPTEAVFGYWLNNSFERYITTITYSKYEIKHVGKPFEQYEGRDWTLSHTFENNSFNLTKNTNNEDFVGSILLSDNFYRDTGGAGMMLNGRDGTYRWSIKFNSQNTMLVTLPQIPQEIENWIFNSKYEQEPIGTTNDTGQRDITLITYEGLTTYEEYLQQIIKDNTNWYLVSPSRESVTDNPSIWNNPVNGFYFPFD